MILPLQAVPLPFNKGGYAAKLQMIPTEILWRTIKNRPYQPILPYGISYCFAIALLSLRAPEVHFAAPIGAFIPNRFAIALPQSPTVSQLFPHCFSTVSHKKMPRPKSGQIFCYSVLAYRYLKTLNRVIFTEGGLVLDQDRDCVDSRLSGFPDTGLVYRVALELLCPQVFVINIELVEQIIAVCCGGIGSE